MNRNAKFYKDKNDRREYYDYMSRNNRFYEPITDYKTSTTCVVVDKKMVPEIYMEEAEYLASCLYINNVRKEYIGINLLSLERSHNVTVSSNIRLSYISDNYPEFYEEFFDYKLNPRFIKKWNGDIEDVGESWRIEMKVSLEWFKYGFKEYIKTGGSYWSRRRYMRSEISDNKRYKNKYFKNRHYDREWNYECKEKIRRKDLRRELREMYNEYPFLIDEYYE